MTGIGVRDPSLNLDMKNIQAGDAILVSGPVGDHGAAVMLAREAFGLRGDIHSDSASVTQLTQALYPLKGLRFMRDPTRGGLATVMHEIAQATQHSIKLFEEKIPIRDSVNTVCDMLGYDPLYLACEGRVVAVVDNQQATEALQCWQNIEEGKDAKIIGQILDGTQSEVILETSLGGERYIEELEEDPLPRIC